MATLSSQRHTPFIAAILANLEDDHPKLVFADFLDETGEDDLAFAYRWAVAKGKRPMPPRDRWLHWWEWRLMTIHSWPTEHALPTMLITPMTPNRLHDSYEEAMQALAAGLAELRRTLEL